MIKGIIFLEDGSIQQIGELTTLRTIIESMRLALPKFIDQEKELLYESLSDDDLEAIITRRNLLQDKKE